MKCLEMPDEYLEIIVKNLKKRLNQNSSVEEVRLLLNAFHAAAGRLEQDRKKAANP